MPRVANILAITLTCRTVPKNHDLIRSCEAKRGAGTFIEKIGVEALGTQQGNLLIEHAMHTTHFGQLLL